MVADFLENVSRVVEADNNLVSLVQTKKLPKTEPQKRIYAMQLKVFLLILVEFWTPI